MSLTSATVRFTCSLAASVLYWSHTRKKVDPSRMKSYSLNVLMSLIAFLPGFMSTSKW